MSGSGASRFPVSGDKAAALAQRLARLSIREDDLEESFVTSGGKGGQNVNKVATCVWLVHRSTGTHVKCQDTRSQGMNRYLARQWLCAKIETARLGQQSEQVAAMEKIRRQKRRRSRRAKQKMLTQKRDHAATKALRGRVRGED